MENKSPKLSLKQYALLKWMLGAGMGLVSVSTVFNLSGYSYIPAIIAFTCISVSLFWPAGFARLPNIVWRVYAIGIIPLMAMDVIARDTVAALLNLNTWLIIYRALNHQKRREELQLVLLCLFLLIMTGILTASLLFGVQMFVFFGLAISFLVVSSITQCSSELDGESDKKDGWNAALVLSTFRILFRSRYLFTGTLIYCFLIGLSSLVFLVVPRVEVENKVTLFELKSNESLSGFSDNIRLGDVTSIKNDASIALRVDVNSSKGVPVDPYWRMLVLDTYQNGSFSVSNGLQDKLRNTMASPFNTVRYWPDKRFSQVPSREDRDRWTVFVEPGASRYLPIVGTFEHLTFSQLDKLFMAADIHSFALSKVSSKMFSFQLEGVDFSGKIEDYGLMSSVLYNSAERRKLLRSEELTYPVTLLQLPADKKARKIFSNTAKSIIGGDSLNALEFARRAVEFLGEKHDYSMDIELPSLEEAGVEDPVARWLNSDLDGHCEFFASSLVLMARSAGFPARVAVGYRGGEWNSYENYFMVRNADAHAWCEIYDGEGNWVRVDPTPGSSSVSDVRSVQQQAALGVTGSKAYLDSLKMLWYRRVVNFDEQAQREAALQLKDFLLAYIETAESWLTNAVEYFYRWIREPWGIGRIIYFTFLAVLLVVAICIQNRLTLNYKELIFATFRRGDPIRRKAGRILSRLDAVDKKDWSDAKRKILLDLQTLRYGAKERWPNARMTFKGSKQL
ncbi:transglutaminaseTgpA domain-containing protein [Puniceicoccaceae bacterium K14]|nr:transglutaminaseTgpA domain-containing protein [Puniceicoccaceae bacterium K14]